MAWTGKYSYSIYLWNLVVQSKLGYREVGRRIVSLPFYLAASIGDCRLAASLIEMPFLGLRDKSFPPRA